MSSPIISAGANGRSPDRFALFDLDGTLVDSATPLRAWAERLCADYEMPADDIEWIMDHRHLFPTWQQFVGAVAGHLGRPESAGEWSEHLLAHYPPGFVLDPAAAERLESLRARGWRLGIVTNGETRLQTAKMDQVRLQSYVDVVCISEAEGVRKPDRAIFESAARKLGTGLGPHGWMVGDTLAADIAGGIGAGLRTVWLPAAGTAQDAPPQPRPDHVRASIVDALDLILASS
jgi:FMN phosphatase YigB (HAD superfamily)